MFCFIKKYFFIIPAGLILPIVTFAINDSDTTQNLLETIQRIYKFLLTVAIPVCVIIILWAAFTFATSGGDATKTGNAKKILTWAIIGLLIILISNGLVSVLGSMIGVKVPELPE